MTWGGNGLPKVLFVPIMAYLSMPCGRATPEMALQPFQEWPARRAGGLQPSSTHLETPRCTPMIKRIYSVSPCKNALN
jgi:hypothetical protein